jgi:glycosyltransferase involved in cell wall biosynthesis
LLARGFPAEKCVFINNGIDLAPFAALRLGDFAARIPGLVMCARFARQKDHATLLQALALLKAQRGITPPVVLLGGGKPRLAARMRRLCQALGLDEQVEFSGHSANVPEVLARYQVAALITHYEGMPLALVEAMAAGCAVLGSDVVGVHELLAGRELGLLVPPQNPQAVADALFALFSQPAQSAAMAARAREYAFAHLGMGPMLQHYAALYSADSP